ERAKKGKEPDWEILFLGNLSTAYLYDGQIEASKTLSKQLIANYEISQELDDLTTAYTNLGACYQSENNYTKAIEYFERAIAIEDNELSKAIEYRNLGLAYEEMGNLDTALYYFQLALEVVIEQEVEEKIARYHIQMGDLFFKKNDYQQAIYHYEASIKVFDHYPENQDLVTALCYMGSAYSRIDDYEKALALQDQALKKALELNCGNTVLSEIYNAKGNIYLREDFFEEAEKHFQLSLQYDSGQDAILYFNQASVFFQSGQYEAALDGYLKALEITESVRQELTTTIDLQSFDAQYSNIYEYLAATYIRLQQPYEALFILESLKTRAYIENGLEKLKNFEVKEFHKLLHPNQAMLYYANTANNEFLVFCLTHQQSEVRFLDTNWLYDRINEKFESALQAFQNRRNISDTDSTWFIKTNLHFPDWFANLVLYYTQRIRQHPKMWSIKRKNTELLAQYLYQFLIQEFKPYLQGKTQLTIIPDRVLYLLPFESLLNESGQYLIEEFDINYLPNLSLWNATATESGIYAKDSLVIGVQNFEDLQQNEEISKVTHSNQLAAFRHQIQSAIANQDSLDPYYRAIQVHAFPQLQEIKKETHTIQKIFPKTDVLTDYPITPKKINHLLLGTHGADYRLLHFATHGIAIPSIPELSALVFQQDELGNRYINSEEIKKWRLKNEFVNLSACETALGTLFSATGTTGLVSSFLIAGIKAIQVSLWEIHDQNTVLLVQYYYQALSQTNWNYPQALATLKRACIQGKLGENLKNPLYWSNIILFGAANK
ncbi:MAG: CHAT domain-containing tetratricopeptide repeat protein, partial [Bacteroidota bacterium]